MSFHKLWILKLSLVKVRGPELQKKCPSVRAAQKFGLDFWDIFVLFDSFLRFFDDILNFDENSWFFTIGFPTIMKISQKSRPKFHAARIDWRFFRSSGPLTFTRDKFRIHSLWENYPNCTGEWFRALFRDSNFFVPKNFWNRVVTYLWERDISSE